MSETIEHAQEGLEHAHHAAEHGGAPNGAGFSPRSIAILIASLAAALALAEMGEKSSQNAYLTHHISVSDNYAFLQARNIRADTLNTAADVIDSLPGRDEAAHTRADTLRKTASRMIDDPAAGTGRKQLLEKAKILETQRDEAFEAYHHFERSVGALQIAIVLASVSVVTRVKTLAIAATLIGTTAALYAGLIAAGVI